MSNITNDQLYDLAAETLAEIEEQFSDDTMPRFVQNEYGLLQTALKRDDIDGVFYHTHELGQWLANDKESL